MNTLELVAIRDDAQAVLDRLSALLEKPAPPPVSSGPLILKPTTGLADPAAFFDHMRDSATLGPELVKDEVDGCNSILEASAGVLPLAWCAYALATAWWETGGVMAPNVENLNYTTAKRIREVWPSRFPTEASALPYVRNARGLANLVYNATYDAKGQLIKRMGNRPGSDDGWNFRGRGQGHLTGRDNYERADRELGLGGALVAGPDLANRPDLAAKILVIGMRDGWFTGKRLNDFINAQATAAQFTNARVIINPDRNGAAVAKAAVVFRDGLSAGGWR